MLDDVVHSNHVDRVVLDPVPVGIPHTQSLMAPLGYVHKDRLRKVHTDRSATKSPRPIEKGGGAATKVENDRRTFQTFIEPSQFCTKCPRPANPIR